VLAKNNFEVSSDIHGVDQLNVIKCMNVIICMSHPGDHCCCSNINLFPGLPQFVSFTPDLIHKFIIFPTLTPYIGHDCSHDACVQSEAKVVYKKPSRSIKMHYKTKSLIQGISYNYIWLSMDTFSLFKVEKF